MLEGSSGVPEGSARDPRAVLGRPLGGRGLADSMGQGGLFLTFRVFFSVFGHGGSCRRLSEASRRAWEAA